VNFQALFQHFYILIFTLNGLYALIYEKFNVNCVGVQMKITNMLNPAFLRRRLLRRWGLFVWGAMIRKVILSREVCYEI